MFFRSLKHFPDNVGGLPADWKIGNAIETAV
jgi:hypothetical protein